MADDDCCNLPLLRLQLLQHREHKDCCLPHARLCLTEHVHAQDGLWYALVLHCNKRGPSQLLCILLAVFK